MYHHDQRDYDQALKEAHEHLETQMANKLASAQRVLEKVLGTTPVDRIVGTKGVRFSFRTDDVPTPIKGDKDNAELIVPKHTIIMGTRQHNAKNAFEEEMHKHALNQAAGRAGIPETFINRMLTKPYGAELICENLNTIFSKEEPERFLVRSVDTQVRGVLSDTYRRMDSRPILEAFAETCQKLGARPVEGVGGDLRFSLKAILPKVYRVGKKKGSEEVFAFGASLSNSDFGCGALSLQFFLWRIWCSNTATRDDSLRRVHLGKRLADDIVYSQETYEADTKAMVLAVRDHVKGVLAPPKIEEALGMIETALDTTVEPKTFFDRGGELEKLKLTKSEIDKAREAFNNGGVEQLPMGNNVCRMAQAVAWIAQAADSAERRLELERVAGQLMEMKKAA